MNKRNRILKSLEEIPDIEDVRLTGEMPISDELYALQIEIYFAQDQKMSALGVVAKEPIKTKDTTPGNKR
jgi:hypothetical protein